MEHSTIRERLTAERPVFSIEFFPPKTDAAAEQMLRTADRMAGFEPDFASITYGAGGGTRERTLNYATKLKQDFGYEVMPHLTCVGHARSELETIIDQIRSLGLRQIMALRGDAPAGDDGFRPHPEGLRYANELVALIREIYPECAIGVAGYPEKHPEASDIETDLRNLKRKVDAGADFITTQLFFENRDYFTFVERCRAIGIEVPILPGLMSITSLKQAIRFCAMCGASIPESLESRLRAAGDDTETVEAAGVEWTINQASELLDSGVPGLHLYILNRAKPAIRLMEALSSRGFKLAKHPA